MLLKRLSKVMELPWVYALWMRPFVKAKLAPIFLANDLSTVRRVLDVGCGPGTNTPFFPHAEYVGLDINPAYVETAQRKFGRTFVVADVCTYSPPPDQHYDFVLLNSLLHHIDDASVDRLLDLVRNVVTPDGHIHIIELVLPDHRGIPRYLALNDRGDFARPLETWRELLTRHYESVIFEPFTVGKCGIGLWDFLYFKGKPKR